MPFPTMKENTPNPTDILGAVKTVAGALAGGSSDARNVMEAAPPPSPFIAANLSIAEAVDTMQDIVALADRLCGPQADGNAEAPSLPMGDGLLAVLQHNAEWLSVTTYKANCAIKRIKSLLP